MTTAKRILHQLKKRSGGLGNAILILLVLVAVSAFQSRNMLSTAETPAPALRGELLRGGSFELADQERRPALVYFFAPWCRFCAASSDNLVRLRRLRSEESLTIVAVALGWRDIDEVRDYVDRHAVDLPVVLADRQIAEDWRVYAFPTYYVVDSDRRIRRRDLGYSTQLGLWWRTWVVN